MKKYIVKLTEEERTELTRVAGGKNGKQNIAAWKVLRAKVLLKCDQGTFGPRWTDERLAAAFDLSVRCLEKWRQRAVEEGPLAVLERKPRFTPPTPPKLDGEGEAQLTKLACSVPPPRPAACTLPSFSYGYGPMSSLKNSIAWRTGTSKVVMPASRS